MNSNKSQAPRSSALQLENSHLTAEILRLRHQNAGLRAEVQFLRANPMIAKGVRGEDLIATILSATRAKVGAGHDLELSNKKLLIEVKYSSLLNAIDARPLKRWCWSKLFGELGNKKYDRLLLIGDIDPRFASSYADPMSPYVIFDAPYAEAVDISGGTQSGRRSRLHLTTNPSTVKSWRSQVLFQNYQVRVDELHRRYPNLDSAALN